MDKPSRLQFENVAGSHVLSARLQPGRLLSLAPRPVRKVLTSLRTRLDVLGQLSRKDLIS